MSDTPTAGEAATKTRMLNSFLDNVKTNIQNSIVWDTGNRPADGTTQTMQSAVPELLLLQVLEAVYLL